jgi:hypothetical protein
MSAVWDGQQEGEAIACVSPNDYCVIYYYLRRNKLFFCFRKITVLNTKIFCDHSSLTKLVVLGHEKGLERQKQTSSK